jgi:hypothetical protein
MPNYSSIRCLTLVVSLSLTVSLARAQLVEVNAPNATETDCNDINNAGTVVGTTIDTSGVSHGFILINGEFSRIDFPAATATLAYGINDPNAKETGGGGTVVGWYTDSSGVTHGYELVGKTFTTVDFPGATMTNNWSVTNTGEIVGTYTDSSGVFHGFTDVGGTFTTVDYPGSVLTEVTGINSLGSIVGIWDDTNDDEHGFQLIEGKFVKINYPDLPPGGITSADRINHSGEVVGLYGDSSAGPFSGYTRINGTFSTVMFPGSTETRVRGVNDAGVIVGRFTDTSGVIHGFMGTP